MIIDRKAANFAQMPIHQLVAAIWGEKRETDRSGLIEQPKFGRPDPARRASRRFDHQALRRTKSCHQTLNRIAVPHNTEKCRRATSVPPSMGIISAYSMSR